MTKRIISISILLIVMLFTINVRASEKSIYNVYTVIEKGENSGELYNSMPTQVSRGDIITVKIFLKNAKDFYVSRIDEIIRWDKSAFELVENNGKYIINFDGNILAGSSLFSFESSAINAWFQFDSSIAINTDSKLLAELKFKVKDDVKDGIYSIIKDSSSNISISDGTDYNNLSGSTDTLKYQVGKTKLVSSYNKDSIANRSYVIGNHLFATVRPLRTEHIMLAAKTINSEALDNVDDKLEKMVIYFKDSGGDWVNAINNEPITPPNEFNISYVDLMETYLENGIYSNAQNSTIVRLIQYSKEKALITIEKSTERIHGIATMNGNVATLTVDGTTYNLTISENSVALNGETLSKVTNNSVADYLNNNYSGYVGPLQVSQYINSEQSGKYVSGNVELYLLRQDESAAKICMKTNNQTACSFSEDLYGSSSDENTYVIGLDETVYSFKWTSNQIEVKCLIGTCDNSYINTYTKEKAITAEDVFNVWEENTIEYAVIFDKQNGEENSIMWIPKGKTVLFDYTMWDYYSNNHEKEGQAFIDWKVNGEVFNPETVINSSITLVATYKALPGAPTVTLESPVEYQEYYSYDSDSDVFTYHFAMTLDDEYDGFELIDQSNPGIIIDSTLTGNVLSFEVAATNESKTYTVRPYITVNGINEPGQNSIPITVHPVKRTITFITNGGTPMDDMVVPYSIKLNANDIPTPQRAHYDFDKWLIQVINGENVNYEPFSFNSNIMNDITLSASWIIGFPVPTLKVERSSAYEYQISLDNYQGYCANYPNSTENPCTGLGTDNYTITGYRVYEVTNEGYGAPVGQESYAPHEVVTIDINPNVVKRYVAIAYVIDAAETIESEYSDIVTIDTTIPTPVISFNPTYATHSSDFEVENWIQVDNLSDYCIDANCTQYSINGFEVYKDTASTNSEVNFGTGGAGQVTANYLDDVTYYVRAIYGGNHFSAYSSGLTLDTSIPAPEISLVDLYYDNGDYLVTLDPNYSIHYHNSNYGVDGYDYFEKNGETLTDATLEEGGDLGNLPVLRMETGTTKTFVARAYKLDENNHKVYSPISNEITIDLVNPTFTWGSDLSSVNGKVGIIGFINGYRLSLYGIKINDVIYDQTEDMNYDVTISLEAYGEIGDTLILGLAEIDSENPNNFTMEVSATHVII